MFAVSDHIAIQSETTSLTYRELIQAVKKEASRSPDYVTFPAHTSIESVIKILAAFEANATLFPQNYRLPFNPILHSEKGTATLLLTSGSTGTPKVARHTRENYLSSAKPMIEPLGLSKKSRYLLSLPLYHVAGLSILFRTFLAGATLILSSSLSFTHCSLVPAQLEKIAFGPEIECILLGGGPVPPSIANSQALPIRVSYGLTEMTSTVLIDGVPLPGRELRISKEGELQVKGPMLFKGYLEKEHDGWFSTGDLAQQDHLCRYKILGRKDHMFISGGENIQPEEIESILMEIAEITEAVVVPKECPIFGQRPIAFIRSSLNKKEITNFLRRRLPGYKIPKDFLSLPQNSDMKRNRQSLMEKVSRKHYTD